MTKTTQFHNAAAGSAAQKQRLRQELLLLSHSLPDAQVKAANAKIARRVLSFPAFLSAASVFIYMSTKTEPCTKDLIHAALQQGKRVYIPKCKSGGSMIAVKIDENTVFAPNRYGLPEPVDESKTLGPAEIALAVIPCVGANEKGARLGHGGGYYDRFLAQSAAVRLCLCFDALLRDELPMEETDARMDYLITETKSIRCGF